MSVSPVLGEMPALSAKKRPEISGRFCLTTLCMLMSTLRLL